MIPIDCKITNFPYTCNIITYLTSNYINLCVALQIIAGSFDEDITVYAGEPCEIS